MPACATSSFLHKREGSVTIGRGVAFESGVSSSEVPAAFRRVISRIAAALYNHAGSPVALASGARLGPYEIGAQIGVGGMGEVWRALDTRLGRPVALKLIRDATTDPDARARLEREARLAASVSHPAICQVYELAEIDGQLVLAMELLQGAPLAARLGQPFPPAEAVSTALTIIGGLGALHERGIVHRDLKPSNIFITPHGVKLLDFGLARPVFPRATDATLAVTENGHWRGDAPLRRSGTAARPAV